MRLDSLKAFTGKVLDTASGVTEVSQGTEAHLLCGEQSSHQESSHFGKVGYQDSQFTAEQNERISSFSEVTRVESGDTGPSPLSNPGRAAAALA